MRSWKDILKSRLSIGFLLVLMLAIVIAWANRGKSWTEEVLLEDGSTIIVERTVKFKETVSWSGDAYVAEELDATIAFTDELAHLPKWRQAIKALVLYHDRTTDEWVVVASTTSCSVWERRGKPKPSYWEFRLKGGEWHEVPLSAQSVGRKTNLLVGTSRLSDDHVTVENKRKLQANPRIARKYREIWGDPDMYICGEGDTNK